MLFPNTQDGKWGNGPEKAKPTAGIDRLTSVQLKYYPHIANGSMEDGTNVFPEKYRIGFVLANNAWSNRVSGFTGNNKYRAATSEGLSVNNKGTAFKSPRTAVYKYGDWVMISFEDFTTDENFSDVVMTLKSNPVDAITDIPTVDPDDDKTTIKPALKGTFVFEDLWPSKGDYDMNDVMVKYTSTMTRNALDNRIYEIEDKFILQHCGGYLQNGFGYQLHKLSNSNVKSVKITGPDASGLSSSIYMEGKETEPGQSHPTILLYDDMTKFKNITDESKKEYTVTITLDGASEKEVVPPYNPFIFISSNEGRGKELHLINYPPTDKADLSLLGTGKDIYRPEEGMYYVSADLMPFAINMPVSNLPVPEEGKRIDQSYPKFSGWVSSNGKQNKDWYK